MECMNRTPAGAVSLLARLGAVLIAATSAACGPQVIEGRPPFIGISAMQLVGETLSASFRISNENGVPMDIEAIDIEVTVNDVVLARENKAFKLAIDANSAEEIHVDELPGPATRELLLSLENREVASLPFSLQGNVRTLADGVLRFEQKGHLYPVPGKPGEFRSAVTQADELRREKEL
jgi:hypothetical protein